MKGPTARRRAAKARRLKGEENANKAEVRERDVDCRFPLCPCWRFNLFLEVSHKDHKGMGGDPTGERSAAALMVLVCNWRHKEDKYSIDKHGIRWAPLTAAGANGPIAWLIDIGKFSDDKFMRDEWIEIARESRPGVLEPLTVYQREILEHLGSALKIRFARV